MNTNESCNGIISMDHPVVAVEDMQASKATYQKLGFTIPPRGSHVEWGTGNWCIMFSDDYLELRGIIDASRFIMNLDTHLEQHGEGLMGVAFGTDNAKRSHEDMMRRGIRVGELRRLRRNFELEDGWIERGGEARSPQRCSLGSVTLAHAALGPQPATAAGRIPAPLAWEGSASSVAGAARSARSRARPSDGRPHSRMNPPASFWS